MPDVASNTVLTDLRSRIERLEHGGSRNRVVLPFGMRRIDAALPGGGLALGALHEVAGGGNGAIDGAAAALFAAGIAARTKGKVLWCVTRPDLFAPALAQAGLDPDRVIYVEAGDEKTVLACFEEGLRHGGLGAVVAEVARLSMTASRRLQLAAESSGTIGIAVRRWRRQTEAADFGQPTAAVTRWRVSALPSAPLPVPGVGRARWLRRADPLPRRRERRFRSGGLRCHGSSRSSCRPGRPIGCGGRRAPPRLRLRRRWSLIGRDGRRRVVLAADAAALRPRRCASACPRPRRRPSCADLVIQDADPAADAPSSGAPRPVGAAALRADRRADPPDGLVIDTTGADHLHGGEEAMLGDLVERLAAVGHRGPGRRGRQLGRGACAGALSAQPTRVVACRRRPRRCCGPCRSPRCACPADIVDGLRVLGFDRIGELAAQPRAPLALRFGPELGRRLDQAMGRLAEPIAPLRPAELVEVRRAFAEPIGAAETIARYIGKLVVDALREARTARASAPAGST